MDHVQWKKGAKFHSNQCHHRNRQMCTDMQYLHVRFRNFQLTFELYESEKYTTSVRRKRFSFFSRVDPKSEAITRNPSEDLLSYRAFIALNRDTLTLIITYHGKTGITKSVRRHNWKICAGIGCGESKCCHFRWQD